MGINNCTIFDLYENNIKKVEESEKKKEKDEENMNFSCE